MVENTNPTPQISLPEKNSSYVSDRLAMPPPKLRLISPRPIIDLSDMSRRVLFSGNPGDGISMFDWVSDERFVFMPQAFEQVGRNMNALQVFAMNADGSRKRSLLEYNFGAEGLRGFEVYNTNPEVDDEVFVYWNKRRSRVSDYYKLNINTGVPKLLARGPDIKDTEVFFNFFPFYLDEYHKHSL